MQAQTYELKAGFAETVVGIQGAVREVLVSLE